MKELRMIVNEDGKPVSVILSISTYKEDSDELEELEEIRAYDKAKKSADEILPFEEALDKFKRKEMSDSYKLYSQQQSQSKKSFSLFEIQTIAESSNDIDASIESRPRGSSKLTGREGGG